MLKKKVIPLFIGILFLIPVFADAQPASPTFTLSVSDDTTTVYSPWNIGFSGATVTSQSNGSALVTIASGSGTPGGSATQIQYNNSGAFGGISTTAVSAGGNVGIGTTTLVTNAKMTIAGNGTTTNANTQWQDSGGNAKVTILDNGNLGIGSISPSQLLDVNGTAKSTGAIIGTLNGILKGTSGTVGTATSGTDYAPATSGTSILKGNGSGGFSNAISGTDYAPATSGTNMLFGNGSGGFTNVTTSAASGRSVGIGTTSLATNATATIAGGGASTNINTQWQTNAGAAKVTILDNGNVGIGSTAPEQALIVSGTANATTLTESNNAVPNATDNLSFFSSTTSAQLAGVLSDETGSGVSVFGTTPTFTTNITDPLVIGGSAAGSSLTLKSTSGVGTTDTIIFQVGNNGATEAARFNTSGYLGIGTTVPLGKVDIVGIGTTSSSAALKILDSSKAIKTVFLDNGNVGIGSTAPAQVLDVNGAGQFTGSGNSYLNATAGNVGIGTSVPSTLLEVGVQKFNVLSGGNVGIGSTNPGDRLDIGTGKIVSHATTGILSKKTAANQACNTTCSAGGCMFGEDTGVLGTLLDCADATADVCFCLTP